MIDPIAQIHTLRRLALLSDQMQLDPSTTRTIRSLWRSADPVIPDSLKEAYRDWTLAATPQEKAQLVIKYKRDILSIQVPPYLRTIRGKEGPTFIVGYPRLTSQNILVRKEYVLKWTNRNEIDSARFYRAAFRAPRLLWIHFEKACLYPEKRSLTTREVTEIKETMLSLGKPNKPEYKLLMIAEKVRGLNFADFLTTTYSKLNLAEKRELFKQIGELSLLDLISGNMDRIIDIRQIDGAYRIHNEAGINPGNLMVDYSAGFIQVTAIDNGGDAIWYTSRKAMSTMKAILQMPKLAETLAESMVKNCINGISVLPNASDELKATTTKDLEEEAALCFEAGLRKMHAQLPKWKAPSNSPYYAALSERLNLLTQRDTL